MTKNELEGLIESLAGVWPVVKIKDLEIKNGLLSVTLLSLFEILKVKDGETVEDAARRAMVVASEEVAGRLVTLEQELFRVQTLFASPGETLEQMACRIRRNMYHATCDACGGVFDAMAERCPSCGDRHKLSYGLWKNLADQNKERAESAEGHAKVIAGAADRMREHEQTQDVIIKQLIKRAEEAEAKVRALEMGGR